MVGFEALEAPRGALLRRDVLNVGGHAASARVTCHAAVRWRRHAAVCGGDAVCRACSVRAELFACVRNSLHGAWRGTRHAPKRAGRRRSMREGCGDTRPPQTDRARGAVWDFYEVLCAPSPILFLIAGGGRAEGARLARASGGGGAVGVG
eukprot:904720-Prymnesium_polylepis.1